MQASETRLRQLIEGTRQYVVPLFQRPYSWSEKHWKTLWLDVLDQSKHADGRPHFFGSIVTAQAKSVPQGVGKFTLIDGQQRMTTTQLFLAAIRDAAEKAGNLKLRDRINGQYMTNGFEEGDERLKLLPTQADRPAFRAIAQKQCPPDLEGRLAACYRYFEMRLERRSGEDLDKIHAAIVDRLSLVSITCDDYDNPHLIFESLNAKGEKLTPADLIRNFLLMRVHVSDQERLFKLYWFPVQQAVGDDLTEFVRHYLMKEGKILKEADVYFELKDRLVDSTPDKAEAFLLDLHRHGEFYARFVDPKCEMDLAISERLDRIKRMKVTVAYPFLLRVFDAYTSGQLSHQQVIETLDVLESFVIRRSICNAPTNQLRRMLPPVFDNAGGAGPDLLKEFVEIWEDATAQMTRHFIRHLQTEKLYSTAEKNTRLRLILEQMEQSFGHREPAILSSATIEHVLPQTLTSAWEQELGTDAHGNWEALLHTLGNLTLSAYNQDMSNDPYSTKRNWLMNSHFELNRYFSAVERWTPDAIRARAASLASRALKIWPDVARNSESIVRKKTATSPPLAVRFRNSTYPVGTWKDGFNKLLELFDSDKPGLLERIAVDGLFPAVISVDEKQFQVSQTRIGEVCVNNHASAKQIQIWCRKMAKLGEIAEDDYNFVTA